MNTYIRFWDKTETQEMRKAMDWDYEQTPCLGDKLIIDTSVWVVFDRYFIDDNLEVNVYYKTSLPRGVAGL